MKNLVDYMLNESQSEQVLLVLHCIDDDGIMTDYHFWTSLPEDITKIINFSYVKDEFKNILQKKAPKAWKTVEEVLEHVNSRDTKARVWTERIKPNKIKKL